MCVHELFPVQGQQLNCEVHTRKGGEGDGRVHVSVTLL